MSAGVSLALCPTTASLMRFTWSTNCWGVSSVVKPGMLSSLSIVPPVWPSPRPDILATGTPADATRGPTTSVVVSPTPPVECLSTFTPLMGDRSTVSPEATSSWVRYAVSSSVMPRK